MVSALPEQLDLTVEEVAAQKRVSANTVYRWINDGVKINGVRVILVALRAGKQLRIRPQDLDQFDQECNPEEWKAIALRQEKERREARKDRKRLHERLAK